MSPGGHANRPANGERTDSRIPVLTDMDVSHATPAHLRALCIALFLGVFSPASVATSPPPGLLAPGQVTLLGEHHGHPESPRLVEDLVEAHLQTGQCLAVALEIRADQQPALDALVRGKGAVDDIAIYQAIDQPALRGLLEAMAGRIQDGACLTLHAIDAPRNVDGQRDRWMASRLQDLVKQGPAVLVLVGNLHALKRVHWKPTAPGHPYLAERLVGRNVPTVTALQHWPGDCSNRRVVWSRPESTSARRAIARTLRPVAAHPPRSPLEVTDWVVTWQCAATSSSMDAKSKQSS